MADSAAPRPRRRRRLWLWILLGIVALLLIALIAAALFIGPYLGFYLIKPSAPDYAEQAADRMEAGLFADGPQWTAARERLIAETRDATSYEQTYPAIERALKVAGGKHSFFVTPAKRAAGPDPSREQPSVSREGGVTTIRIPELGAEDQEFSQRFAQTEADGIRANAAQTCGWIIDLRGNRGGTMWPMLAGVGQLLPDGDAMYFKPRVGQQTAVTVKGNEVGIGGNAMAKVEPGAKITQPVAVLQDADTASSGEAVLVSFRGLPNTRTFGTPSAGYSSANQGMPLADGAVMQLTTSVYADRAGRTYGDRIAPDTPAQDAVTAAKAWLASKGCR
ncbi:S41 family peptidase [Nigerium massiliense]|uniref:S41 family peptidase n=1 Tax=Nigerium massiliense TaxID=1522317 RepID=UPI000693366F|nr:S41 family peptidase [Nigerium massiliense]